MKKKNVFYILITVVLCVLVAFFSLAKITYSENAKINNLLGKILPLLFAVLLMVILLSLIKQKVFAKPQNLLYLLPCLLVAINNLPFIPWINGLNKFANIGTQEVLLFTIYCFLVGAFEEMVFRGLLFPSLLHYFDKDKKGLIKAMVYSSLIFGLAHVVNLFGGAGVTETLLQVAYSALMGGVFVFAFVKTKSIISAIALHSIYNFGGLLFNSEIGLGLGVYFDMPTVIITAVLGVLVGAFVIVTLIRQPKKEVEEIYKRF